MKLNKDQTMRREREFDSVFDKIPAPDATEMDTDTAWVLFGDLEAVHDVMHADSAAVRPTARVATKMSDGDRVPAPRTPLPAPDRTLDQILTSSREQRRACPTDAEWVRLYKLLAASGQPYAAAPRPPLTGPAGRQAPALEKRACFRDQLTWAATHGCIRDVKAFIARLTPAQWQPI